MRTLSIAGLIAWASDAAADQVPRDARDAARAAVAHDRIVAVALQQGGTPVPASLADPYADDAELLADLEANASAIRDALASVRGRVEMTTIVALAADRTQPAPGSGRAYLEALRSRPARLAAVADRVQSALASFGEPSRRDAEERVSLSHLIERALIDRYRAAALGAAGDGYRLVVDGPRAPYSFARFSPRRGMILAS